MRGRMGSVGSAVRWCVNDRPHGLVIAQRTQAEVVDNQQVGGGEAQHSTIVRAICPSCSELLEEVLGSDMKHAFPKSAGAVTERLCDVRLADAGRFEQEDVLTLLDEAARR